MFRRAAIPAVVAATVALINPGVARATTPGLADPRLADPRLAVPSGEGLVVPSGETLVVAKTTYLHSLTVETGAHVAAADGQLVTLTVDGVETGQKLITTAGVGTEIQPGTYRGNVVLTPKNEQTVSWFGTTFPIRQALRVTSDGVDEIPSAVIGGTVTDSSATGVTLRSTGEDFNGLWVASGDYGLSRSRITYVGNGRYDFVGAGASVVASGAGSRLVVDGVTIDNTGVVRTGIEATDGSNLIVKNSTIKTHDGTLPADYQPTLQPGQMRSAPWMLGIIGNVRATNLVGTNTTATYIGDDVFSTGWGVLSTDSTTNGRLTAINTRISTGTEGYGSYADGQTVTDRFLGSTFDVNDYAVISTGGTVLMSDSDPATLRSLNTDLDLRLTPHELAALRTRPTTVNSGRFGIMWHGGGHVVPGGTVTINDGTTIATKQTTFIDKGLPLNLTVDGAHVTTGNGVVFQLMESDDPGPVVINGNLVNQGVYTEPTGVPAKVDGFDVTAAHSDDAIVNLKKLTVRGDFYNGLRGARNLVLNLSDATVTGAISSSTTRHAIGTITAADYKQISEVTNTASPTVNNGVVLSLTGHSVWQPTGTSYLTRLDIAPGATIRGHVRATVDGVPVTLRPGTSYVGTIVITAS